MKLHEKEKLTSQVQVLQNKNLIIMTLFADVLHGGGELLFEELALLGDLLSFLQEVLSGALHGGGQDMGLFGAPLLLVGWTFVTGVNQGGDLIKRGNRKWF